jgi:DnaJ-class molecular chaperone
MDKLKLALSIISGRRYLYGRISLSQCLLNEELELLDYYQRPNDDDEVLKRAEEIIYEAINKNKGKCIPCNGTGTYVGGMYSTKCRECDGTGIKE